MKADGNGFLIADKPLSVEHLSRGIDGVRTDTSAILAILKTGARQAVQDRARVRSTGGYRESRAQAADGPQDRPRVAYAPRRSVDKDDDGKSLARIANAIARERDERGRFMAAPTAELTAVAKAINSMTLKQAAEHEEKTRQHVKGGKGSAGVNGRNSRGRFMGGSGVSAGGVPGEDQDGGGSSKGGDKESAGVFARLKDLSTGVKTPSVSLGDYDKVDPTVGASKELGRIVSGPLNAVGSVGKAVIGRGFGGTKNTTVGWFRRIFNELHLTREEASEFALAETRVLKDIERKTGGGAKGVDGKGLIGSVAGGLGGLGGLLGKGGGLMGNMLGVLGKGGKGLLKRLPLLGALFAGGSALASIFGGDDPNKSAEQNRTDRFTGAGSGIGSLIGGGLGMLLGPVGAIVGGVLGDKVGELVGAWLATVDWTEVGKSITGAWDTTVSFVKDSWTTVTGKLGEITKSIGDAWTAIITGAKAFVKNKFGIDIDVITAKAAEVAKPALDAIKNTVGPLVDKAKEVGAVVADKTKAVGSAVVDYGKERIEKMAAPITTAAANAVDFGKGLVGGGSAGNRAALMRMASGIRNENERAAFLAQADHETGGFKKTEENLNYKPERLMQVFPTHFKSLADAQAVAAGGPEVIGNRVYGGRMGNKDDGDGYKFRGRGAFQLTGRDNYTRAGKALGLDLVNDPDLMKDPDISAKVSLWYWNDRKGLAEAARAGDKVATRKGIQGAGLGLADTSAKTDKYLAAIRAGDPALTTAPSLPPAVLDAAASAPPPAPPMPTSSAPAPLDAPPTVAANIPQQLNTPGPIEVRVAKDTTVGQDLTDRRLAQIATGGIST